MKNAYLIKLNKRVVQVDLGFDEAGAALRKNYTFHNPADTDRFIEQCIKDLASVYEFAVINQENLTATQ